MPGGVPPSRLPPSVMFSHTASGALEAGATRHLHTARWFRRRTGYRHLSRGVAEFVHIVFIDHIGQISATQTTDLPYTRISADQLPIKPLWMVPAGSTIIPPVRVSQPGRRCAFYFSTEANPCPSHRPYESSNPAAGRHPLSHGLARLDGLGALPPATGVFQPRAFLLQTSDIFAE